MAVFVATNRKIQIAAAWTGTAPGTSATPAGTLTTPSDLSAWCPGGDVGFSANMVDVTTFGSGGYMTYAAGLLSGDDIQIPLLADFATSQGWSLLTGVFGTLGVSLPNSTPKYVDIMPTSSARSATNPSFVAAVFSKGIQPIAGAVGARAEQGLVLQVTGAFAILTA
jgi:hypothetical protein